MNSKLLEFKETEALTLSPRPKILSSLIPKDNPNPVSLLAVPARRILPVFLFSLTSISIDTDDEFSISLLLIEFMYLRSFRRSISLSSLYLL